MAGHTRLPLRHENLPMSASRSRAQRLQALRRIAQDVRRRNPTGLSLPGAMEERRYAQKAALQSRALEEFADLIVVEEGIGTPGVVLLSAPEARESLSHAVVERLSLAAQEAICTALSARSGARFAPPSDDSRGSPGAEDPYQVALARFDYELARRIVLEGMANDLDRRPWVARWLDLMVDVLGDLSGALAIPVVQGELSSDASFRAFARLRLHDSDWHGAFSAIRGRLSSCDEALVLALVDAAIRDALPAAVEELQARLATERGALSPEVQARFAESREVRCAELRRELEARGNDPTCATCRDIALAISRIAPGDASAVRLLEEGQRRHRERHARSALEDAEELFRIGRIDAARAILDETRPKARPFDALRERVLLLERSLSCAALDGVVEKLRRDLRELPSDLGYLRFARAKCDARERLVGEWPVDGEGSKVLEDVHALADVLAAEDAVRLATSFAALPTGARPLDVVRALSPHRSLLARFPRGAAAYSDATRAIEHELEGLLSEVDLGDRVCSAAREGLLAAFVQPYASLELPSDLTSGVESAVRALADTRAARAVLEIGDPAAKLDAARTLGPRVRAKLRRYFREDWLTFSDALPAGTSRNHFTLANGTVLGAVSVPGGIHLCRAAEDGRYPVFVLPTPCPLARLETRGEVTYAIAEDGQVLAFRANTLDPEMYRTLGHPVAEARVGPGPAIWAFDASSKTLCRHSLVGEKPLRFPCVSVVWGETQRCYCAYVTEGGRVFVLDSEARVVSEHPIGDYSVFGLGEHPVFSVPLFAVRHKESGTPTLSYRSKEVFVTEWLDDAPAAERVTFHSGPNGTLDVVFLEASAEVSVRRYALLDLGFSEIARKNLGAVAVLSAGRGRLWSVRLEPTATELECTETNLFGDPGGLGPHS